MVLIYDDSGTPGAHDGLIAALRAEDKRPRLRSARHYRGPEAGVDAVYTDDAQIAADYAVRGVNLFDLSGDPVEGFAARVVMTDGIQPKGGGHYDIMISGEVVDTVQGEAKAHERYNELTTHND